MIDLSGLPIRHSVAVMGLGRSGLATVRALVAAGIAVHAWDDDPAVRDRAVKAGVPLTDLYAFNWAEPDLLVLSPGISLTHPKPHPLVLLATGGGCEIVGDVELLFRAQPDATYIGITGTNGKSTTTALVGHILKKAGRRAEVGANLGLPVLDMAPLGTDGFYVLEMSSYQIDLSPSAAFRIAALLNVSPDHLDRHGGFTGYKAVKKGIFRDQDRHCTAVIGVDDDATREICAEMHDHDRARVVAVSGRHGVPGVYVEEGVLYDNMDDDDREIVDLSGVRTLPGTHNHQNAAAAYAVARAAGVAPQVIAEALLDFPGLAHRQEVVAVVDGVTFINDSKATNPDAAARALACYENIYWIAGGRAKDGGFAEVEPYLDRVRAAFLIGEAAGEIAAELKTLSLVEHSGALDLAVPEAFKMAREELEGAVVLLSPACASFDQFANFEARGEAFRAAVAKIVEKARGR